MTTQTISDNEIGKTKAEIRDLGSRLYYCSNSGEGRRMRKYIEHRIRELESLIQIRELSKENE